MYFASTVLGFVIAVGVMAWIDLRLTLVALLPLPGVTVATWYFGNAIHDRFERIQAQLSDMSAVVQEALSGVRVVRAYRQEAAELDALPARQRRVRRRRIGASFGCSRRSIRVSRSASASAACSSSGSAAATSSAGA